MTDKSNVIASALYIVGILAILGGTISGAYYGTNEEFYGLGDLQGIVGMSLFANGVIWGIVFFGFAEVIKLLQGIFNQRETQSSKDNQSSFYDNSNTSAQEPSEPRLFEVSNSARKEIEAFYNSKDLTVQDIKGTVKNDFFVVTVDGKNEIVELGGFNPIIINKNRLKNIPEFKNVL